MERMGLRAWCVCGVCVVCVACTSSRLWSVMAMICRTSSVSEPGGGRGGERRGAGGRRRGASMSGEAWRALNQGAAEPGELTRTS